MNKHIQKWSEKLLDLSKRNNLISFKDSKSSVIEVVHPDVNNIFKNLLDEKTLEVYIDYFLDEQIDDDNNILSISKNRYIDYHIDNVEDNQILLFKDKINSKKILKNISKKNNEFFQEKGLNITKMSLGFINWSESNDSNIFYKAPILIVPISLENLSATDPYTIKRQDDIVLNETFKYKLKEEYNIELEEFNTNDNIEEYFDYIATVIEKLNWYVTKEVKISNLPFSKINMYIDLIENVNKITNNPVVQNIIEPQIGDYEDLEAIQIKNREQINVVSADSSQMEAIDLAIKGQSFVLEGPPGTGKSQTITNIIAALLAEGKKVLFVSEKKAALDVVLNNLKNVNLDQFCIPLHGTKLNKKDFIKDIYETMKSGRQDISRSCEEIVENFGKYEISLDEYSNDLHKNHEVIDSSLYQVMSNLIKYNDIEDVEYVICNLKSKGEKNLKEVIKNLEKLKIHFNNYGFEFKKHFFYGLKRNELTYEYNIRFKKHLNNIKDNIELITPTLCEVDLNDDTIKDITNTIKFKNILESNSLNNKEFLDRIDFYYSNIIELSELSKEINDVKEEILSYFKEDIFELDSKDIYEKLVIDFSNPIKRFFSFKYKKLVKRFKINASLKSLDTSYSNLIYLTEKIKNHVKLLKVFDETDKINNLYIKDYAKTNTNWDNLIVNISFIKDNIFLLRNYDKLNKIETKSYIEFERNINYLNELISNKDFYTKEMISTYDFSFEQLNNKNSDIISHYDTLYNWMNFIDELEISKKLEIYEFVNLVIEKKLDYANLIEYYLKTYYLQWYDIMAKNTIFQNFNVEEQDRIVREFKKSDNAIYNISRDIIISKLSKNRPNIMNLVPGSAVSVITREHEKKAKIKSILTLMNEIPQFIQEIKPCFLMSPLAVSTYLNPNKIKFDVTIFDEASQIFPHDAVGAIYRSDQAIVVGDSKQMPPTNFFSSTNSDDEIEDEEQSDVDAFESILDLFKSSYPTRRLLWHYRSKVETLISFSNEKYYDNNLISFPSTFPNEKYYGVDFYHVADGVYSPERFNIQEAIKVVDLIFENIKKFPNRSLGVIAFNKSQQEKIEELLENRRKNDIIHEAFFNNAKHEPFFIKNLETVQGDERDTIIFSICFGKNSNGTFRQNFGPLSKNGGERRLNVAVTRAKYNLQVVSSITASDINISNTKYDGPKHLRTYLDFAKNGLIALDRELNVDNNLLFDSYFEEDVYNFLKSKGFCVDTQVGCSSYRIDLALKDDSSSNYYLAIECDGATYHSSKTARDRDKLRQLVLENMGWKFYRIWSTDWFKNNRSSKEKLLSYINNLKNTVDTQHCEESLYISNLTVIDDETIKFPEYEFFDTSNINRLSIHNSEFSLKINEWIRFESPLSKEVILKKVSSNFYSEKVTQRVRADFNNYFKKAEDIILKNGFYYLENTMNNQLRVISNSKRELEFISDLELAKGLYTLLDSIKQCDKENLFKYLAKELGYKNVTEKSLTIFNKAFIHIEPFTILENGMYRIDYSVEFKLT